MSCKQQERDTVGVKRKRGRPRKIRKESTSDTKQESNDHKPEANNEKQEAHTKQQEANNEKQEVHNEKQEAHNEKQEVHNEKQESHNEKQETHNEKQEANVTKTRRGRPPKRRHNTLKQPAVSQEDKPAKNTEPEKHRGPGRPRSLPKPWSPKDPEGTINLLRVIKRFGKLKCQQCQKQFNSAQYYAYHIKWCGREEERAMCPICNSNQKAMWLHAHILEHRRKDRKEEMRQEVGEEEATEEFTISELRTKRKAAERAREQMKDLDLKDDSQTALRKYKKGQADNYKEATGSSSDEVSDLESTDSSDGSYDDRMTVSETSFRRSNKTKASHFWIEAYHFAKKYYAKYAEKSVLLSLLPSADSWEQLPDSKTECYLPIEMTSIKYEVSHTPTKRSDKSSELHQLGFGESHLMEDGFIAYCGGAIWAMDWCPVTTTLVQYLAVACHRDFNHVTVLDRCTTGPGVIQLWNLGKLHRNSNYLMLSSTNNRLPKLECIIATDDGAVLDLKWCPLGGWCDESEEHPERLGLLAVATSSGYLHIYSPCLCLTWFVSLEMTRLAAGFADGTVSVWNLSSSTSLNRDTSDGNRTILWPCITFLAHGSPVSGIDFCPSSPDLLVSCGYERNVKHWDLREPDLPLDSCQLRSKLQSTCWPPHFNVVLAVSDQCYAVNTTATYCVETSEESTMSGNVFLHDGCVWGVRYSYWTNAVIVCDVTGDVFYMLIPRLYSLRVQQKLLTKKRMSLLKVRKRSLATESMDHTDDEALNLTPDTDDINVQTNVKSDTDQSEAVGSDFKNRVKKKSWKNCLQKYVLDFNFSDKNVYTRRGEDMKSADYIDMTEPPVQSINRVVFSPNSSCYTWAACGGQAGLLCLRNVPSLKDKRPGTMANTNYI
ncbi:hypothetical protein LSH36_36g06035 [Paralvinella palmiformis]|uniref:Uncharacterized protein n=1 Tax=Paralvinella palmiformis TaxID=53620 RepID=A0AAD9K848_9ANNE|nr:hypothetical protein LSH36_36g06035 [Paralvinella palmiformis]